MNPVHDVNMIPWNDPDDLIQFLHQLGEGSVRAELIGAVEGLLHHEDPDVQEEALRLLLVRWKVRQFHAHGLEALHTGATPEIRTVAAFGVAATSSSMSRMLDVSVLKAVLSDDEESQYVRAAAYDALLILFKRPVFPTKQRAFDATRDVDWSWIETLSTA